MDLTQITDAQRARLLRDLEKDAGESLTMEMFDDAFFAFGSELAILRLANKRANSNDGILTHRGRLGYSKPRATHYYTEGGEEDLIARLEAAELSDNTPNPTATKRGATRI